MVATALVVGMIAGITIAVLYVVLGTTPEDKEFREWKASRPPGQ